MVSTPLRIFEFPPALERSAGPSQRPLIIAHRGAAAQAPENTLAAFDLALERGAEGIELDVHLSSDDVPVVIHDPRLDRTTSGCGRVRDHKAADLRRLDAGTWFNKRYPPKACAQNAGLKIPLLEEALAWVRDQKCPVFIEIKEGGETYPGIEARVMEEIARSGVARLSTIISFDFPTLQRFRELDRAVRLGIIFSRPLHALSQARAISAASLHPHQIFSSPRFVQHTHRAGLQVVVWGVDHLEALRQQIASGIDALITEHPARAASLRLKMSNR
ncbi:MAG: glycerophosphodiester phosphodiesterase [Terriglobia bacterium]